jgi:hypothetical protein
MNKTLWLRRVRNICGLLGGLLPFIAIFSVLLIKDRPAHSLYSISATYYLSPALAGVLCAASIVLMCYDGYSKLDNLITTISGVFGIGIVLFPCSVGWLNSMDPVGFFQLPMHYSNYIHCACAAIFFCLLSFNSFFLFTKTDDFETVTENKKKRNTVYRICGIGMLVFMIAQVISVNVSWLPGYCTMINEIALLFFFAVSWLTKGNVLFFKE